jgi:hypothetical protein
MSSDAPLAVALPASGSCPNCRPARTGAAAPDRPQSHAGQARPFDGGLPFLDPLLRRAHQNHATTLQSSMLRVRRSGRFKARRSASDAAISNPVLNLAGNRVPDKRVYVTRPHESRKPREITKIPSDAPATHAR